MNGRGVSWDMLRRETIIALRARHEAYRIASDLLYPHVDVPPPPQPAIPRIEGPLFLRRRTRRPSTRQEIMLAVIIWAAVLAFWVLLWLNKKSGA